MISALLSSAVAIVVCILNNNAQLRKQDIEQDKRIIELDAKYQQSISLIGCKIDELDRKQAIHNGVIERVYNLEKQMLVQTEKQSVANHRIDDLENGKGAVKGTK